MQRPIAIAVFFTWAALASSVAAASESDQQTPTFFVNATGGYSVYKSEMVASNDTSTTTSYSLGVWAGNERNVGMMIKRESSAFTFALNKSSLNLDWQDTHVRYRFGTMYLGFMLSTSTWLVKAPPDADGDGELDPNTDPEDFIDMMSTGYGINTGAIIPIGRRSSAYVDVSYSASGIVRQKALEPTTGPNAGTLTEKEITLGPRMDLDLGGSIGLTKNVLDALVGFKYRTYSVSVDSVAYKEQLNSTYLGLQAGWQF